ncbi:MAG: helix-turn-helix transcriptional regulator [Victivallaceae bacterium]|nr:helix-turn-helix transcriptional regulator [Victivallaceae bacterium]
MEKREKKFYQAIKAVISKYGIKNIAIAEMLGVTSQYVSKILTGKCLPSREQLDKILELLTESGIPITDQRNLISCFVEDKTGFFYEIADLEFTAKNQLEKKLISDFRMLNVDAQKKTLSFINQLLIEAL